jgi:hypothetical protein
VVSAVFNLKIITTIVNSSKQAAKNKYFVQ